MASNTDIMGYCGMVLLTITLIPQLYKIIKTKKGEDLSYIFLIMNILTCLFFLLYGILLKEKPLIISNSIVMFQIMFLIFLKYYFSKTNIIIEGRSQFSQV
jgi:MtN3 and saliva related transmembrane protein